MNEMILTLNLKEGLFTLDENTLNALGRPRQVQLLINVKKEMLVLRACGTKDSQAIVLPTDNVISTDISGRSLLKKIRSHMKWDDDISRKCAGRYFPMHKAVSFNLSEARKTDIS